MGKQAREWGAQPEEIRKQAVLKQLTQCFGSQAQEPTHYLEQNWSAEPWSYGGPVTLMPPGVLTTFGSALYEPFDRIHWAGTETALKWCGYMDGAIRAGKHAAQEVGHRLK